MQDADQSLASPSGHVMVGLLGPEGRVADPCYWNGRPCSLSLACPCPMPESVCVMLFIAQLILESNLLWFQPASSWTMGHMYSTIWCGVQRVNCQVYTTCACRAAGVAAALLWALRDDSATIRAVF